MANPVPAGSDVSAGTYKCTECGNQIDVGSTKSLPPCPECGNGQWETLTGGDSPRLRSSTSNRRETVGAPAALKWRWTNVSAD